MSATDRLDQIEARANAATKGPWEVLETMTVDHWDVYAPQWPGTIAMLGIGKIDADFIAAARTDVADLVAALRAVLALDMGHSANNPHAYCISPLALRRTIEEALS